MFDYAGTTPPGPPFTRGGKKTRRSPRRQSAQRNREEDSRGVSPTFHQPTLAPLRKGGKGYVRRTVVLLLTLSDETSRSLTMPQRSPSPDQTADQRFAWLRDHRAEVARRGLAGGVDCLTRLGGVPKHTPRSYCIIRQRYATLALAQVWDRWDFDWPRDSYQLHRSRRVAIGVQVIMIFKRAASPCWRESFDRDGFAIIHDVLTPDQVADLIEVTRTCSSTDGEGVLDRGGEVYGVRDLLRRIAEVRRLAHSQELLEIVAPILGPGAFVVRGLFFDKTLTDELEPPVAPGPDDRRSCPP